MSFTELPDDILYRVSEFLVKSPNTLYTVKQLQQEIHNIIPLISVNKNMLEYFKMNPHSVAKKYKNKYITTKTQAIFSDVIDELHEHVDKYPGFSYSSYTCQICNTLQESNREVYKTDYYEQHENEYLCYDCAIECEWCSCCGIVLTPRIQGLSDTVKYSFCSSDCVYTYKYCLMNYMYDNQLKNRVIKQCYSDNYTHYYIDLTLD